MTRRTVIPLLNPPPRSRLFLYVTPIQPTSFLNVNKLTNCFHSRYCYFYVHVYSSIHPRRPYSLRASELRRLLCQPSLLPVQQVSDPLFSRTPGQLELLSPVLGLLSLELERVSWLYLTPSWPALELSMELPKGSYQPMPQQPLKYVRIVDV